MIRKEKLKCTNCGQEKAPNTGFYLSHSKQYVENDGRMTICKECLFKLYDLYLDRYKSEIKAIYHLCMNYDVYFNKDLFDSAYSQNNRSNDRYSVLKVYMQKVNSLKQYKGMSSIDSDHIILSDTSIIDGKIIKNETEELIEEKKHEEVIDYDNFKITKEMINRWGNNLSKEDYMFLEDSYQEFYDAYPHDTPAERLLLKQLSKALFEGELCRRTGDRNGFEKMSKLVSTMLTDSNIKPSQKRVMGDEIGECFGVFIENIEKNEPIPSRIGVFEDVDGIGKYIDKHFVKNFAKVFGISDEE